MRSRAPDPPDPRCSTLTALLGKDHSMSSVDTVNTYFTAMRNKDAEGASLPTGAGLKTFGVRGSFASRVWLVG
jgi:hypothetical protein